MKRLKDWFCSTDEIFDSFKFSCLDYKDKTKRRIFIDRQSDILFVAHADTVLTPKILQYTKKRVFAQGLDDRLGCYTACRLSAKYQTDLLITDGEESGLTTAKYHDCKSYKWVVEFDRGGEDVVTYGLCNDEFLAALSEYWEIGFGSYSDIVELETDCCCLNLGIGYENAHCKTSFYSKKTYIKQLLLFDQFFSKYKNTDFGKHDELLSDNWNNFEECNVCDFCNNGVGEYVHGYYICQNCFDTLAFENTKNTIIY